MTNLLFGLILLLITLLFIIAGKRLFKNIENEISYAKKGVRLGIYFFLTGLVYLPIIYYLINYYVSACVQTFPMGTCADSPFTSIALFFVFLVVGSPYVILALLISGGISYLTGLFLDKKSIRIKTAFFVLTIIMVQIILYFLISLPFIISNRISSEAPIEVESIQNESN
jgi:hypothetical protein